jgi:hypothetical protein
MAGRVSHGLRQQQIKCNGARPRQRDAGLM